MSERASKWVDFLTKYAEEITFEGCGYKLVSPEDADEIADELQALQAEVERLKAERDDDRRREYGYSQQTVDALTKERDALLAEIGRLRAATENACGTYTRASTVSLVGKAETSVNSAVAGRFLSTRQVEGTLVTRVTTRTVKANSKTER